ncbi:DUF4393 domain-containing protein [Pedobacter immunditicola]|uniref:DUF4393 domain-containing protein n=1 Tax=Pedobacter immunditicola TaxID=3133440 RepID=UPI0030A8BAFE
MTLETGLAVAAVTAIGKIKEDSLLGLMYRDLAQPSVQALGKALGTVFEFGMTPLQLMKYGSEVAQMNFKKHIENYQTKLNAIPEEEQIPVNPQFGIPLINKLTYTTNEEIADLFTSLLTKASSNQTVNMAHPAFIQIIERLTVDEARIIKYFKHKEFIPSATFRAYYLENDGFVENLKNSTLIKYENDLLFPENVVMYLENLVSLGILNDSHGLTKINEVLYKPIYEKNHFEIYKETFMKGGKFKKVEFNNSYYNITDFGRSFINACAS